MSVSFDIRQSRDILHFALHDLLPDTHTLVINKIAGSVGLLTVLDGRAYELYHNTLSPGEMPLALVLLEACPYYVGYETLHTAATYGWITEEKIAQSRKQLTEASRAYLWDEVMRPVRNVISRVRIKLRPCGIDIASILETGYTLKPYQPRGE